MARKLQHKLQKVSIYIRIRPTDVVLVEDDGRRIAEASGDRTDDPTLPVPNESLL
jgi:hypothetical protein